MQVDDRSASAVQIYRQMSAALRKAPSVTHLDVVLKPLSRPELGEIRIEDTVLAIGRTEQPFASYGSDVVNMMSRRHAHIFHKDGFVYLADLESRNGTTVNRAEVGRAHCELHDGDEICFGGTLSYRVQITTRIRSEKSMTLTLTPKSGGSRLETIVIEKFPFLVSKTGATFSQYRSNSEHGRELDYLSRRHAYIHQKAGQAYIEDLGSSNGTFVDGLRLPKYAVPLQDRAVVAFGGKHFVYEVSITRQSAVEPAARGARKPPVERKPDAPRASVSVSRQPAVEPAGGGACKPPVERKPDPPQASVSVSPRPVVVLADSGARKPPAERKPDPPQASVSVSPQAAVAPADSGGCKPPAEREPEVPQASDRTQFVVAPTSFLHVFCDTDGPKKNEVAPDSSAVPAAPAKEPAVRSRPRSRAMLLLSELASLHISVASDERDGAPRSWWRAAAVAGILGALGLVAYFWSGPERDLKDALVQGEYSRAAALASRLLEKHPDDLELRARATDAALKANVPAWLLKVRARDFDGAKGVLAGMSELTKRDADLRPLIEELEWLGNLDSLVSGRGGPEAPIRIYADEDGIEHLIKSWNDDTGEHQRALARIASYVPQFGDWYGEALTHLRRLQSESSVYLPIIERVKASIGAELARDNLDALEPLLKETAEKYPGLGGLDNARQDLARYIEIRQEARARKSGRLFALLHKARFVTPPFEHSFHALIDSGQLPSGDLLQQYDAATRAWKNGNSSEAFAALQKMTTGPWGEDAARELGRRRAVTDRFAAIQQSRNARDSVDQLLAFRESLDADEDVYFVRATAAELNLQRDSVIARAQDALNRARMSWQQYRSNGTIDAAERIETSISDQFRNRASLLAAASRYAQQGFLIYSQVDAGGAAQLAAIRDEIESEVREQRGRLHDLSNVVEPELLKNKLALLGETNE
jgi:pSer/pThr/pTyr-binding forkhead associated (FHA) protein